jgi:hypothetical protein
MLQLNPTKINVVCCSLLVLSMATGFNKAVTSQQKQTDSWPSMNILKARFLEHFANLNDPRIETSKEHLLKDIIAIGILATADCKFIDDSNSI